MKKATILRNGDHGEVVKQLQRELNGWDKSYGLKPDGIFGPATERAVMHFQDSEGLVVDGLAGPKTFAALRQEDLTGPEVLGQADLIAAAEKLDVEYAAVRAVNEVESRGKGFLSDDRPVILFERHIMHRRLREHGLDPTPWAKRHPDVVSTTPGGYGGGRREWPRIGLAWAIHPQAALESASYGLFQIMGFHWQRLGYDSAQHYVDQMREGEPQQLDAFVRFIQADTTLHAALKDKDWTAFARGYNGPAYAKNEYDKRMAAAHARYAAME